MRIGYFDCFSGISGDMTLGALADAGVDPRAIQSAVASLGLPCELTFETVRRGGFRATYAKVIAPPEHAHRHLHHIEAMIDKSTLSPRQNELAKRIFLKLGEAEAAVARHRHQEGPLPRGRRRRFDRRHRRLGRRPRPARGRAVRGEPPADGSGLGPGRARQDAPARPRDGRAAQGRPAGRFGRRDGADHPHRRGHRDHGGRAVRPPARHDDRGDRPGRGDPRPPRPGEHPPPLRRHDRPARRERPRLGPGDEPRRPARRGRRLRHRAGHGGRGARRLRHADPDEEEPARRDGHRPLPRGSDRRDGGDPLPRDDHPGRPPLSGQPAQAEAAGHRGRDRRSARSAGSSAGSTAARRRSAPSTTTAPGSPPSAGSPSATSTTPPTPRTWPAGRHGPPRPPR